MDKVYRSYYTKSDPIVTYMFEKACVRAGMRVLEPCAGDGVFVDVLLKLVSGVSIDIYELNPKPVHVLRNKYRDRANIRIIHGDTLTDVELTLFSNAGGFYDRVIANPPYGAWQDYEKRRYLRKLYPKLYVKETYALFLYRCVRLLRDKGLLVFIVPDTFLNLHRHTKLRSYLLTNTKIRELCLFPSSFFPGVNFGYANLCIITLERCANRSDCLANTFKVIAGLRDVGELGTLARWVEPHQEVSVFSQSDVYENIDHALLVSADPRITYIINNSDMRIGDIADCVTGFYSGNDKKYLRVASKDLRNAKRYDLADVSQIARDYATKNDILKGIEGTKCFIPILKGGNVRYYKPEMWYMDWGVEAVRNYKTSKKARFQNSQYYFKYGVGVPMVSASRITAALIENRLFDQSIVGIFTKNPKWIHFLLAFFNSALCNRLIRTINPTANNPANYIKKIPFAKPSKNELEKINGIVKSIIQNLKQGKKYNRECDFDLEELITKTYQL